MFRRSSQSPWLGIVAAMLAGCSSSGAGTAADSGGGRDTGRDAVTVKPDGARDAGGSGSDAAADALPPLVGEGYAVGQIAMNWTLNDQNGSPVNLWDHRGKVIYFESGSEW